MKFMVKTQAKETRQGSAKPSLAQAETFLALNVDGKFLIQCWNGETNTCEAYSTEARRDERSQHDFRVSERVGEI